MKGILKRSSTSVESDYSQGPADTRVARQTSITLRHPESEEDEEEKDDEDEEDGGGLSARCLQRGSSVSSGSLGEELQTPSSNESLEESHLLERTLSLSEDGEGLDINLDGSVGSSLKER